MHSFLGRLTESEKTLKYGVFPEEEVAVQECQAQLQVGASPRQPPPASTKGWLQLCPRTSITAVSQPLLGCGGRHGMLGATTERFRMLSATAPRARGLGPPRP